VPKKFKPGIINPRLIKITLNKNIIMPLFFKYLFLSPYVKNQLENLSHGGTMNIINIGIIKNIRISIPPIPLQQKFAKIVEKVEKLREKQKKSEQEINELFESLMQRAFRGELVR
jgi:type I restriction enzyme S subunit